MSESEIIPLIVAFYKANPTGGTQHIVLDDGNFEDECVERCLQNAIDEHDEAGEQIARLLLPMSQSEREALWPLYTSQI